MPALMAVLIVLLSGVLVSMLALLARADDEGAVSGDKTEEGGSSILGNWTDELAWAASEGGIPPRERSGSLGPYGPNIRSRAAPLPPYHSAHRAHRAVLLAALPAGIVHLCTHARAARVAGAQHGPRPIGVAA